jgi:ferritin-like protein
MSDDLAKEIAKGALRIEWKDTESAARRVAEHAADRIEELEAKLAKAVKALTDIVKDCEAEYPPSHGAIKYFCRTTLAELTGEDRG